MYAGSCWNNKLKTISCQIEISIFNQQIIQVLGVRSQNLAKLPSIRISNIRGQYKFLAKLGHVPRYARRLTLGKWGARCGIISPYFPRRATTRLLFRAVLRFCIAADLIMKAFYIEYPAYQAGNSMVSFGGRVSLLFEKAGRI